MSDQHVHSLSGFLPYVWIAGSPIPIYFIVVSLAFIAALFFLVKRTERFELSRNRALDLSLVLMVSGFVGARLFHVCFEEPTYYLQDFWRVFAVYRGGFVWYGGALFGTACTLVYAQRKQEPIPKWLDVFAPVAALGYGLGRIACWFAGCCYGKIVQLTSPDKVLEAIYIRYPTQLFAVVWEIAVMFALLRFEKKKTPMAPGGLFVSWIALHSIGRIIMELFRADPRGATFAGLSIATLISLALLGASAFLFLRKPSANQRTKLL